MIPGGVNFAACIFIFGGEVMSKMTFYFAINVLFAVEIPQSGYSRKLAAELRAKSH